MKAGPEALWHERAAVILGKRGVCEGAIKEIRGRLKRRRVVKVRILKSCIEREGRGRREIASVVAEILGAKLVGTRGSAFMLARKG